MKNYISVLLIVLFTSTLVVSQDGNKQKIEIETLKKELLAKDSIINSLNKATEKVIEGTWTLSKKAANAAIDHLIKHPDETPIDYIEYELIEIDPEDRSVVRVVNVIEFPPELKEGENNEIKEERIS